MEIVHSFFYVFFASPEEIQFLCVISICWTYTVVTSVSTKALVFYLLLYLYTLSLLFFLRWLYFGCPQCAATVFSFILMADEWMWAFENPVTWKIQLLRRLSRLSAFTARWEAERASKDLFILMRIINRSSLLSPLLLGGGGGVGGGAGGGATGGSLLVLFSSLVCVGWKGGWRVFRQRSNGLQTERTTALSHAKRARTPSLTPRHPIDGTVWWRQETSGE